MQNNPNLRLRILSLEEKYSRIELNMAVKQIKETVSKMSKNKDIEDEVSDFSVIMLSIGEILENEEEKKIIHEDIERIWKDLEIE